MKISQIFNNAKSAKQDQKPNQQQQQQQNIGDFLISTACA